MLLEKFPKPKIDKMIKMAAVLAMFTLPQNTLKAEEGNKEDVKQKIEQTHLNLKKVIDFVKEEDKNENHFLNQQKIKQWDFSNGRQLTIAEDGSYVVLAKDNGDKAFFDVDGDGRLDRVVINQKSYEDNKVNTKEEQKSLENYFYFFDSIDSLSEKAKVVGNLKPENIQAIGLDHEKEVVTMIDFSDGLSGVSDSGQGREIIEKLQTSYQAELEELSREIERQN